MIVWMVRVGQCDVVVPAPTGTVMIACTCAREAATVTHATERADALNIVISRFFQHQLQ